MRLSEITKDKTLNPPSISVGDEIMVGKFKNRKAIVKGFTKDDHGQPVLKTTKGDQKLYKPRVSKLEPKEKNMKLEEITKKEFINKLRDPLRSKTKERMNELRAALRGGGYKISRVKYIHREEWDIIKFVVFFSENEEINSDNSAKLQKLVFIHFSDFVIPKMSDAVFQKNPSRVSFIYFLR